MKRFLGALLSLVMATSLMAGCQTTSGKNGEGKATEATTAAGKTEAAKAEPAKAGQEKPAAGDLSQAAGVTDFLNNSADLGEGSKANPVAVIPINHIDGPGNESDFYAFVNFKYAARDYIKYQITYVSCTCREASVNYWQTAYVELSLPESKKIEDAVIKTVSYDKDPSGKYTAGHWGDSDPIPNGTTYEQIKTEYIPYFVGKTLGQIGALNTIKDIDLKDYQSGDGRAAYTIDTYTGATVSTNNIIRMLSALGKYHGEDAFFGGSAAPATAEQPAPAQDSTQAAQAPASQAGTPAPAAEAPAGPTAALPAPRDEAKTFKASPDAKEETPCSLSSYATECSGINTKNLSQFMGRDDVLYIDLRDFEDYVKKHFRNFETVPFFAYIFNADAHKNKDMVQLYGGSPTEPVPVYEESDELLKVFFPKDKTIFLICQSGGRVKMLMEILEARGWDMSKIYNIGGMAQYTAGEYRDLITDTPELLIESKYSFEGLTRVAP